MKPLLLMLLALGCATAQRGELYTREAAPAARVQVVQLGWNAIESPQLGRPPVEDVKSPKRYRGLVLEEAQDLTAKCNEAQLPFETLMMKSANEGTSEPVAVAPQSKLAYRDAALRLRVGECALVEGPAADYVVKRLE
jgi:hypothetical protein